jgi:hypothetical protein
MDEMVLLPAEGFEEEEALPERMRWLERNKHGFVRAWFAVIGGALVKPGRLIRSVPVGSSLPAAFWFVLLVHLLVVVTGLGPLFLLPMVIGATVAGGPTPLSAMGMGVGFRALPLLGAALAGVVVWGGVTHLMLCLLASPASGSRRTYQAICYSGGANVLSAIPCLGTYFGWIWWLVSAIIMVKDGQKVPGGRATLAVLTLPILAFGAIVAFYVWIFAWVIPATGQVSWASRFQTQDVLNDMVSYAADHRGQGPGHASGLLLDGYLSAEDFVLIASDTTVRDVYVGGVSLARFADLAVDRQAAAVQRAINALRDGVVAHRLGDFVFTYHGVDFAGADPGLWLLICWPDPEANPGNTSWNIAYVGLVDGTVQGIARGAFAASLAQQNNIRAQAGLPPLPDPRTVTHGQPATAPRAEN